MPQSHEPEGGQATIHEDVPEVGASSPQGRKKAHVESSVKGVSRPQEEVTLVLPEIPKGVQIDD